MSNYIIYLMICLLVIGNYILFKKYKNCKENEKKYLNLIDNDNMIMEAMAQWHILKLEKKNVAEFLFEQGYNTITIYGYGRLGKMLEQEIMDSKLELISIIDQKNHMKGEIFHRPTDILLDVDAIIVTSAYYYEEIHGQLKKKGAKGDIICLDSILFQM